MISYVKGILAEKAKDRIVVESGMMGIGIFVPMSVLEVLPPLGEEVKIYTHLQVREDDMSLYGFLSRSDLEMFRQLLGVNGIGSASCGYDWGCEGDLSCTGRWGKDGTADHSRFEG